MWDCKYPKYKLEYGSYYYYPDEVALPSMSDEIAIMFDAADNVLLKHGSPTAVKKYFDTAVAKYAEAGLQDFSKDFVYIEGKIPVDEVNKCIHISGYVKHLLPKESLTAEEEEPSE